MRKLATIRTISSIEEIPNADFLELAKIDGWQCVVKKDEFKEGDKCVYFEIDSILPAKVWSEFMAPRRYKVKTIRLRKTLSQGLALPLETVGITQPLKVGTDLTEHLGVTKFDDSKPITNKRKPVPHKWMMRFHITRAIHQRMYPGAKGSWPEYFPKTDEQRIQNMLGFSQQVSGRHLYLTEKLDGQSCTIFYHHLEKVGFFKRGLFGVCSRNVWLKNEGNDNWWNAAKSSRLKLALPLCCNANGMSLAIQGEIVGPGIQGNKYKLKEQELFVYNIYSIEQQRYCTFAEKKTICKMLNLTHVPVVGSLGKATDMPRREDFLRLADAKSVLNIKVQREGIVVRDMEDDQFSFKAISNAFLLKYDNGR